jgi:hypothetical protein
MVTEHLLIKLILTSRRIEETSSKDIYNTRLKEDVILFIVFTN